MEATADFLNFLFMEMDKQIQADVTLLKKGACLCRLDLEDVKGTKHCWLVDLKSTLGVRRIGATDPTIQEDVRLEMHGNQFLQLLTGESSGPMLAMNGKIHISGNIMLGMKLETILKEKMKNYSLSAKL